MNKSILGIVCGLVILLTSFSGTTFAQNAYTKLCLAAINYEKEGKLDEAVNKYSEAINLKPDEWTGYNYRAKVNLQRGMLDNAITDISKAISLSPQTLSMYAVRANCYEAKGLYDKAIVDYGVALSKVNFNDKEIYLTYYQRGRAYFSNKQYQESVNDFSQALALAQKFKKPTTEIFNLRAQSYLELKRYSEAIADFDTYLSSNPDDIKALLGQGSAFAKNGEAEQAKVIARKIIQLDPSKELCFSGSYMLDIYNLDLRREKSKQLVQNAQILISERSSSPSRALANIKLTDAFKKLDTAWLYSPGLTKEDWNLKDTIMEKFFTVYPLMKAKPEISEQVRRYVVQAQSATQAKKYDDAIKLWSATLNISPYFPIAYYNRALLYEMKGLYRSGISDLEKYLRLMPEASDARSSRDKIYEWEAKVKDVNESVQVYQYEAINHIQSASYSPGNFTVAIAAGGSFGFQIAKNPGLEKLWSTCVGNATPDYKYTDKMPFLYSGDLEIVVKPVKRIGIGAFGKLTGGIGARTKVSDVKYMLNMGSAQYGGLLRYYLILNNGAEKPDLYIQYAYGQSKLNGYYGVATMDGLIYNYSYTKDFKGSAPYNSFGVGMGGKLSKHGYLTMSLDYLSSKIKDFTWEVTTNTSNKSDVGNKGTSSNVNANYNGVILKLMFGFCF
ncbi:MAG: tetratricopeptide repeat protein [Bacteroidales bacterium]|nr:tetratricopeptide repeat protein [Bacteroidales bacterium]